MTCLHFSQIFVDFIIDDCDSEIVNVLGFSQNERENIHHHQCPRTLKFFLKGNL